MAQFDLMLPALTQGKSVRRDEWEPEVRMFVADDILMCQYGNSSPWQHSLTWGEIAASDWQLFQASEQEHQTSILSEPLCRVPEAGMRNLFNEIDAGRSPFLLRLFSRWRN